MARIRSLKPEFWLDRPFIRRVPNRDARMLYAALWNLADEHGRLGGDAHYLKGQCFPYEEDADLTPDVIDKLIDMLAAAEKVVRYVVNGDPYLFLPNLAKHQRLEAGKVPSRLPPPPDPDDPAPRRDESAPDPDKPAPRADTFARNPGPPPEWANEQVSAPAQIGADLSARGSDESARGADKSALLYVAGNVQQVAGDDFLSATAAPPPDDAKKPLTKPSKKKAATGPRPDVDALCDRLVELMVANECKPPEAGKAWRDAARLLLDNDGRAFDKAMRVLEWSQQNWFWKKNIHSMPTFRRQYDKLRMAALEEWERGQLGGNVLPFQQKPRHQVHQNYADQSVYDIDPRTGATYA